MNLENQYFDPRETMEPNEREEALFARLPQFLEGICKNVPAYESRLSDVSADKIVDRASLASIPVLRKPELMEAQAEEPPFGGFADPAKLKGARYFMSPGPIWEPEIAGADHWNGARAFFAAGIGPGDLVHCAISYHMTPGGFMLDEGARAAGASVFPAGVGATEQQVEAADALKPSAYAGTPDYLKTLLDKAGEMDRDLSSIRKALVSGGALFPSLREEYASRGVNVLQCYATADLGVIAYESLHDGKPVSGMIVNEDLILEIVRPGTDVPCDPGEVGEVVVTNFNSAYPLVRFGTGDLSAILEGASPCGRTNFRIKGWMGRADQRTKIKGMFVDPKQVDAIVRKHPEIQRAGIEVSREGAADKMVLKVVPAAGANVDVDAINDTMVAVTKLKGTVSLIDFMPNDGLVIADLRDYSK